MGIKEEIFLLLCLTYFFIIIILTRRVPIISTHLASHFLIPYFYTSPGRNYTFFYHINRIIRARLGETCCVAGEM